MAAERPIDQDQIRLFFNRPADQVASEISSHWSNHEDRQSVQPGEEKTLAIITPFGTTRLFRIENVILYSSEYTYNRWPNSRAPEIDSLSSGDLISYVSRAATLTFIKTRKAENIQFDHLYEVDRFGVRIRNKDSELSASGVAKIAGLGHRARAHLLPLHLRTETGFLLTPGSQMLSDDELRRIEEEILGDVLSDEQLSRIEKEVLDDTGK